MIQKLESFSPWQIPPKNNGEPQPNSSICEGIRVESEDNCWSWLQFGWMFYFAGPFLFYHLKNITKLSHIVSWSELGTIIHAFISSRLDYYNPLFLFLRFNKKYWPPSDFPEWCSKAFNNIFQVFACHRFTVSAALAFHQTHPTNLGFNKQSFKWSFTCLHLQDFAAWHTEQVLKSQWSAWWPI